MSDYRIYVRDSNRAKVGEVDDFRRFEAILRFNRVGSWLLEVPLDAQVTPLLGWTAGVIFQKGATVIQSGNVATRKFAWDGSQETLVLAGPDDNVHLEDRLALPVPSGPPYDAAAYDIRTGVAETVMRQYVDVNAGPSAIAARQVAGLTLAPDMGRGLNVTGRARFHPLGDLLRSLALAGGDLGFRIVQSGAGLQFQVYQPTDRTATAIFSPGLGNLRSYEYVEEASEANYIYCGGSGEGTLRVFREGGDSAAIARYGRRVESFRDRRDTGDAAELDQSISEELSRRAATKELRIEPVGTEAVAFLKDYYLGDKVTVVTAGGQVQDKVREVRLRLGEQGVEITPSVLTPGSASSDIFAGLFDQVRWLSGRLGQLERR